ncbi:hypothetical protein IAU60_006257 [Kwoniella sp. DSM 27419]
MANPNPLLQPPFYVIPGIDPSSPISAQTEQIDQLNTLLLQEIDANFAKFHQIITSKVLPEIKRFAIAGEPTREAAQFWRAFFEAASAIRLPNPGDTTLPAQHDTSTQYDDHTLTLRRDPNDSSVAQDHGHPDDSGSFIFDPPATSSTPMPAGKHSGGGRGGINESWEDSMESPFDRMDRKLRDDLKIGKEAGFGYEGTSTDMPTPSLPSGYSLPSLGGANSTADFTDEGHSTGTVETSQLALAQAQQQGRKDALRPSSATPKANRNGSNPFGADFNGIADLRSTPLNPKSKSARVKTGEKGKDRARPPKVSILPDVDLDSSSDEDEFKYAYSPPVTMNFGALPDRAQAMMKVARTPGKSAGGRTGQGQGQSLSLSNEGEKQAQDILDDLLEEMHSVLSPRLATPEGLKRYSLLPGEIQPEGRLLFPPASGASYGAIPEQVEGEDDTFHPSGAAQHHGGANRQSLADTSYGSDLGDEIQPGAVYSVDEGSFADESFDSDDDDGLSHPTTATGTGTVGTVSSQPYSVHDYDHVIGGGGEGDLTYLSSEGDITTTSEAGAIFGRQPSNPPLRQAPPATSLAGREHAFELRRMDEMDTYHGGRLEDAAGNDVMSSPTHMVGRKGQ